MVSDKVGTLILQNDLFLILSASYLQCNYNTEIDTPRPCIFNRCDITPKGAKIGSYGEVENHTHFIYKA